MIDLRSDTVTKPSPAMREAMARAEVGDDIYGEDPTVNRLQEVGAALVGKRAALFVPSGTLGNQLSLRAQAQPGHEVIVEGQSHIIRYEQGAAAALAGVQLHWVTGKQGLMTAEQVQAAIRPKDPYSIQSALICIENTHNAGGGRVYPLSTIHAIRAVATAHGLPMHLDGARLFNAVVASGVSAAEYARHFDTVTFCLSKGLGAPAGSLIATDDPGLLERLRRFRRMYGGAMRQSGILAAAGLYALEHHIQRLSDDHAHAKRLAARLQQIPAVTIDPTLVETNILFFDVHSPKFSTPAFVAALKQEGVLINAVGGFTCRAVTHLDVSSEAIEQAADHIARVLNP
ncbi:MAG: aminotransferase class I/II-fold pyridoxal phosphate-dependent enzyme [Nitrospiraceae bacterium]|jgi:threonine aldolase|nr:aminotransferase class I/II-fold pyridoxal phosphate-dependent enzyme [Nitrospira sp. CR1.1]MBX3238269.1 aminotransferase class I/II-fold pyridoxal phosphate-dependent enzyme [Nitrospiraceae bacterium]